MTSLENNPGLIAVLRESAKLAEETEKVALAALLKMAADALEHTHQIATTGWLET